MVTFTRRDITGTFRILMSEAFALPLDADSFTLSIQDLSVRFFLRDDPNLMNQKVWAQQDTGKSLLVTLTNFSNPLGVAWESVIGNLNGDELHISLAIHAITGNEAGRIPRVVTYAFFAIAR